MTNEDISKQDTYTWLKRGNIYLETEGFLLAIQDQVIATRNYLKHIIIIKDTSTQDDKCRKYNLTSETIDHITAGCKILAGTEYTDKHNIAIKIIHKALTNKYELENNTTPYYKYTPTTIIENEQ